MMYCSNCGNPIDEGSKFCKNCGSRVNASEEPNVEIAQSSNKNNFENTDASAKFKLNDEGIKALIKQNLADDETESYYFYGVNMASFGKTMLLGVFATLSQKYFICNVTNKGIHFYGLTQLGKPKDYSFVPKNAIKSLKVANGLLGLAKVIEIEYNQGGKMKITANKQIRGIKEQGKNLETIAKMRI